MLLAGCPCAFALNPALDVSQYAHTAWRVRDGFIRGSIGSMAQTPDGYVWLGTELGLLRFDGIRAVPWQPLSGQQLPSNYIRSLLAARDGTLWVGTLKGLASWKDGRLTLCPKLAGMAVDTLLEDENGTIWAGGLAVPVGRLCAIRKDGTDCHGEDGTLGNWVEFLFEDSRKNIWAATSAGLWRWTPGPPKLYPLASPLTGGPQSLIGGDRRSMLITTLYAGIEEFVDGNTEAYSLPGIGRRLRANKLFRDRNGALWVGITREGGLAHVHEGKTDLFSKSNGLSGDTVLSFFEDREGSIWVATNAGLDRFRTLTIVTHSVNEGLSNGSGGPVLPDRDGSVWIGTSAALNRWKNGQIVTYDGKDGKLNGDIPTALFQDSRGRIWAATSREFGHLESSQFVSLTEVPSGVVRGIAEDTSGNLWIANQSSGLIKRSPKGDVQVRPWDRFGHKDFAIALAAEPLHGGVWLGFYDGGVVYFDGDESRASYTTADGLGAGFVGDLRVDGDGTVWAATQGGLSRLRNGRIATLTSKNGLPCDAVHWAIQDDQQFFWLNMPCGLVRVGRPDVDAWTDAADKDKDTTQRVQTTVFDSSDGLRAQGSVAGYAPQVTRSSDGKLLFTTSEGVSVVDPSHLPFNRLPPPVHIEQITADREIHDAASAAMRALPALTRDLEIDYTALSLVAPEKNRFRIKLEGWDREWQDVGNRRQAFYSNLPPRNYRFRVKASNNSGVWNDAGAALDFSIAPAYYQTTWFRVASVLGVLALGWAAYRYRLRQIAYEFDARLQERVNERTRIARELHDTLLQSFHGLLFRFQAATNMLPDRPIEAKQKFENAIDQAAQAITEGRDAVQNLRASTGVTNDLGVAISALGEELAAAHKQDAKTPPTVVEVAVEGTPRDLHPILRDDIYRIAGEALRNAFRHAGARRIEVEIRYGDTMLHVQVRDDGKGIDAVLLDEERPGHFGIRGMRERAELVGGHLDVWSKAGLGTEVELTIPAAAAYATPRVWSLSSWFARRTGTST